LVVIALTPLAIWLDKNNGLNVSSSSLVHPVKTIRNIKTIMDGTVIRGLLLIVVESTSISDLFIWLPLSYWFLCDSALDLTNSQFRQKMPINQ
jgi:hypothetical protein